LVILKKFNIYQLLNSCKLIKQSHKMCPQNLQTTIIIVTYLFLRYYDLFYIYTCYFALYLLITQMVDLNQEYHI